MEQLGLIGLAWIIIAAAQNVHYRSELNRLDPTGYWRAIEEKRDRRWLE